ncbi:MAG: glutathione S-transferase family protein [Hyphomicrobiales bacterium]|nr:glutathione S-transferase family protein [Rickettsiales bacterium]MCP5362234.1 glutathione S-transferase family protein [Hyphomicrobiales bacterium]
MRTLYHYPLSPFSRKVRVFLKEKSLDFELVTENFWERRREFLAMNPAAQVPVLIENDESIFADSTAICEYLEETYPEHKLIGNSIRERADVRRISSWFNNKFYYEVTKHIVDEKVFKYLRKQGAPDSNIVRVGQQNMLYHLDFIGFQVERLGWLAAEKLTLADITAASHLSVLDYLGDVPWEHNIPTKEWYMLVKSRPSFRSLLNDRIPGFAPPPYYAALDF